jgi:hypothetical protein
MWNKQVVEEFTNAELYHSQPPVSVVESFRKDETRAAAVSDRLREAPDWERLSILQDYLLASTKVDSNLLNKCIFIQFLRHELSFTVHIDSRMHIKAVQWHGIDSEEARCMAHK